MNVSGVREQMMLDKKELKILKKMMKQSYITSREVESLINASNKTARKCMLRLQEKISRYGAVIDAKTGKGYALKVVDKEKFSAAVNKEAGSVPADIEDKTGFLVRYFIEITDYVKISELADILFASQKVVSNSVKKAEGILNSFNLKLERRPHYGMRLAGREYDIRRCIAAVVSSEDFLSIDNSIWNLMTQVFDKHKIRMSETAMVSFQVCLQITADRVKKGCFVEMTPQERQMAQTLALPDLRAAEECAKLLEKEVSIRFPEDEVYYIALHIADKRFYELTNDIVIDEQIGELVTEILNNIFDTYGLDFKNDLEIYTMLAKHIVPLRLRLVHGNMIKNPVLEEVRSMYPFAFSIAQGINPIIEKYFGKKLNADELGYIAIAIQMAYERKTTHKSQKKNILLVCASGNVFSNFLRYRFSEMFSDSIGNAYTCDYVDLATWDFSKIDYVFTTVPIETHLPVPIYLMDYVLDQKASDDIKEILSRRLDEALEYFSEELFLTKVYAKTNEEVIKIMCDRISRVRDVPDDFYECVMKREEMLQTAFDSQAAMPHPYRMITKDTFVCVCVLAETVKWGNEKVKVVFLVSISPDSKIDFENFYDRLFEIALSKERVEELAKEPTFEHLTRLLSKK